jgi:hypothetical protein
MLQLLPTVWQSLIFTSPAACRDWRIDVAGFVSAGDTNRITTQMPEMRLLALPQQTTLSVSFLRLRGSPYTRG